MLDYLWWVVPINEELSHSLGFLNENVFGRAQAFEAKKLGVRDAVAGG